MTVYFATIFLWWFYYYFNISEQQNHFVPEDKIRKRNVLFMGIVLFLLMGLRGVNVGVDTLSYKMNYFEPISTTPSKYFFYNDEWGFLVFVSSIKFLLNEYQVFLLITGAIISFSFSMLFYKTSQNIFLSFLLHLTVGLFTMTMSGTRQSLAVCFTIFAFFILRWKGNKLLKLILYALFLFLAYIFHNSALIFIPVILFQKIKLTKNKALVLFVSTLILCLFRTWFAPAIELLMPERYRDIEMLSDLYKLNAILGIMAVFYTGVCLFFWNPTKWTEREWNLNSVLFVMSCINLIMVFLGYNSNQLNRLSYYFVSYNMILIPNVIDTISDKETRIVGFVLCVILSILAFAISTPGGTLGIDNYQFFWQ